MTQAELNFNPPKLSPQCQKLYDRLMIAPLTNAQMRDELRLLSYTRRLSDLRDAGYTIKKEYIGEGLFRYSITSWPTQPQT